MATRLTVMALSASWLLGCAVGEGDGKVTAQELAGQRWELVRIGDDSAVGEVWIEIGDDRVSGSAGCNGFSGNLAWSDQELELSRIAATKKFCPDDALMAQESRLLSLLAQVGSVRMDRRQLVLETNAEPLVWRPMAQQ